LVTILLTNKVFVLLFAHHSADEGSESEESSANDSGNELPNAELQNPSGHVRNEQQSRIVSFLLKFYS